MMINTTSGQGSFFDADYICEQLIPRDSFYRKFREVVRPLIKDDHFKEMYCSDNGRPPISPPLLSMATILHPNPEIGFSGKPLTDLSRALKS